jgi:hypothetical protein
MMPVFGDFLGPAGEHIGAAVSLRGPFPYSAQCGVICQLRRLASMFERYLADLPLPDAFEPTRYPGRNTPPRAMAAKLALDRAVQALHPAAAAVAVHADDTHPAVGHLAAAASYLAADRDLLQTHFALERRSGSFRRPAGNC